MGLKSSSTSPVLLPDEVWLEVALYLPPIEIARNLFHVCRRLRSALDTEYLWKTLATRELGDYASEAYESSGQSWKRAYSNSSLFLWDRIELFASSRGCFHHNSTCALFFHVDNVPYVKVLNPSGYQESLAPLSLFRRRLANGECNLPCGQEEEEESRSDCRRLDRKVVVQLVQALLTPQEERSEFDVDYLLSGEIELGEQTVLAGRDLSDANTLEKIKKYFMSISDGSTTSSYIQLRFFRPSSRCLSSSRRKKGRMREEERAPKLVRVLEQWSSCPWGMPWIEAHGERFSQIEDLALEGMEIKPRPEPGKQFYWAQLERKPESEIRRVFENRIGILLGKILKEFDFANLHILSGQSARDMKYYLRD